MPSIYKNIFLHKLWVKQAFIWKYMIFGWENVFIECFSENDQKCTI